MAPSLPAGPATSAGRGAWTRWTRHGVVIWLLILEPLRLALVLDTLLPRLASLGAAGWSTALASVALVAAGIAVARRMREDAVGAWRGVTWWALAAAVVTIATHAAPLATTRAPSEARLADAIAVVAYLGLALVAWRAHVVDGAARESS